MFFHYEVFPTGLDFYPGAGGCSALGRELRRGVLGVLIMNVCIYIKLANSSPNTLYTKLSLPFVKESLKS